MPDPLWGAAGAGATALSQAVIAQFATANAQYGATASGTVGNSVAEATLIGSGTGSLTVAANAFTAGKSMLVYAWGNMGDTGVPTLRLRAKIGGVTILDTTAFNASLVTGTTLWQVSSYITCRTTGAGGTGIAQGVFSYFTTASVQTNQQMVNTTTFALNTTVTNVVDFTAQWGTADPLNTITATNFSLLLLG